LLGELSQLYQAGLLGFEKLLGANALEGLEVAEGDGFDVERLALGSSKMRTGTYLASRNGHRHDRFDIG
jgi:hypothetical protein